MLEEAAHNFLTKAHISEKCICQQKTCKLHCEEKEKSQTSLRENPLVKIRKCANNSNNAKKLCSTAATTMYSFHEGKAVRQSGDLTKAQTSERKRKNSKNI